MKIPQHISNIRGLIKKVQDDTPFVDQLIYSLLVIAGNRVQYQKDRKNRDTTNPFNWDTFCIKLEVAHSHDCSCIKVGCNVLKSVIQIPKPRMGSSKPLFNVRTLGDKLIPFKLPEDVKADLEDEVKSGKPGYMIRNQKLIIWNNLKWGAVQVSGVWEDITDWNGLGLCDDDGNEIGKCADMIDREFKIDADLVYTVYQLTLDLLKVPLQITDDITSDNQPEIKR